MIAQLSSRCGDEASASCMTAGDFIFLAHHGGEHESQDIVQQMEASLSSMEATLQSAGASMDDVVQINLYLKNINDADKAKGVFSKYFKKTDFSANMTMTTQIVSAASLCRLDAVAYKKSVSMSMLSAM